VRWDSRRAFEDSGGKIIQKIFTPLATPDYGSYVAQVKNADAIFLGTAGSNGFRFLRQFIEYGLKDKMAVIGGMTALDESVLRNMATKRWDSDHQLVFRGAGQSAQQGLRGGVSPAIQIRSRLLCRRHLRFR